MKNYFIKGITQEWLKWKRKSKKSRAKSLITKNSCKSMKDKQNQRMMSWWNWETLWARWKRLQVQQTFPRPETTTNWSRSNSSWNKKCWKEKMKSCQKSNEKKSTKLNTFPSFSMNLKKLTLNWPNGEPKFLLSRGRSTICKHLNLSTKASSQRSVRSRWKLTNWSRSCLKFKS